ncbi:MAG: T9SS type A sorting domain-containing protein [Bacteroidales bacterium]|nr:T9SS type A sorting domain-containing protein [Bacteroidales bacterium]
MKRTSFIPRIILALALLVMSLTISAQTFEVVNSTRSNLELSLNIDDFNINYERHNDIEGQTIELNGIFLPNKAGMPNLPVVSRYIAIPRGASVNVNVNNIVTETLTGIELIPAPELPLDDDKSPMKYYRDEKVYSTDAFFPQEPIITSEPMKIRDVDVVILSVTPFQYNPVSKELVVARKLNLEVSFEGGDGNFGGDPRYLSKAWEQIVRDMVINENVIPYFDYQNFIKESVERRATGCEYLIITPNNPDFFHLADSIKLFRNQQGILTDVVTVNQCGGNTGNAIHNYIKNAYNNWDVPLSAVLILGDHNSDGTQGVVSYTMNNHPGGTGYNPYISDNKYGDMNNDHLPDVAIGRITGRNYEELYHMINKDLQYERTPPTNERFYDKPITAMGFQLERWFQLCSEVVNGFWEFGLEKHPVRVNAIYQGNPGSSWSTADYTSSVVNFFGPNGLGYIPQNMSHLHDWSGTGNDINEAVNAGAFLLQHRDHGAEEVWGEPAYSISSIKRLVNPDLTFVMSNNCLTGRFNYAGTDGCFAEAFHRHQYGALGIVAATQVSYSFLNDVYVWGVYDNMWPDFMPIYGTHHPTSFIMPGFGNASGKFFLQQSNWISWGDGREITYYLFHHHGDVYMNLYTEMPQNLDITMLPVVVEGSTQYQIKTDPDATICLTSNGEIIGLATGTGQTQTISITPQELGNNVVLTVTKQNYYRYTREIAVIPNQGPYLVFSSYQINDQNNNGQIDFKEEVSFDIAIHNVGFANIQNVGVELSSDSPYVQILSSSTTYQSIGANEISNKANAFTIKLRDNVPDQTVIPLYLNMNNGDYSFTDKFNITVNAPNFVVTDLKIKDENGNLTGRLYKGETSQLVYTVKNQGHSRSNAIKHVLKIDAPVIDYQDYTINTDGIEVNDSIDVTFVVTVTDEAPDGAILDEYLKVISNGYKEIHQSTIPLGNCIESFENEELNNLFRWSNNGTAPWIKDDTDPYDGDYCYTSTSTSSSRTSRLLMSVTTEIDDIISFYYKGSGNSSDVFTFTVNTTQFNLTGNTWKRFEYPLSVGKYLFNWTFTRKSNAAEGSASIDLIKMPPMRVEITAVDENYTDSESNFLVYPNPGNNELNIVVINNTSAKLQMFDFQGRMILEREINDDITTLNTDSWAPGLYFWKIGNETGKWIKSK